MRPIQFGLVLPAEFPNGHDLTTYVADADRVLNAVAGHFDSAWVVDHLESGDALKLEAFTTLAYLAARHPQLEFGHAVLAQAFRNPALVAKMSATLQLLTGGRYVLGIGAGCDESEHRAYGYDFPPAGERVEQLEEAIQIIRALWSDPTVTFEGRHRKVADARCEPRPNPPPLVMIGAFRPKMLRLVARYADWWNVSSCGPVRYGRMAAELERACAEMGRDPFTIRRTWIGSFACAESTEAAQALAAGRDSAENDFDDFGFVGTAEQIAGQMRGFVEQGVDYFMLDMADYPRLEGIEVLFGEVVPALRG